MSTRIDLIEKAVEKATECSVEHLESTIVVETFKGETIWEGVVEVFALQGHPKAKRAYGWNVGSGPDTRLTVVLEIPPVDSPLTAVRASLVAESKNH